MTDTNAIARELQAHMRSIGHHVDVDATMDDDGHTLHINVRMRGPWPLYVLRWMAYLPLRAVPPRLLSWVDDRVVWHVVRGHDVTRRTIVGDNDGPMHQWHRYCHTCEVAW